MIFNVLASREDDKSAISAAFNVVVSLEVRLDMIEAAATIRLRDKGRLLEEWKSLETRVANRSRARNKLVHLTAVAVYDEQGGVELKLMPSLYKSRMLKKSQSHAITLRQIRDDEASFNTLAEDLNRFLGELVRALPTT